MPDDKKARSTYSTAQFISAYGAWIASVSAEGGIDELHKEIKTGAAVSNKHYTRPKFNSYFISAHNADMKKRYPNSFEDKLIAEDTIDNTKISQIFNYVKSSLVKEGWDKNAILKLPPARVGKSRRNWDDVAAMFLMGDKKNSG